MYPDATVSEQRYKQRFIRLVNRKTGELLVPEELRPMLAAEAERNESNLTETSIRILCKTYGVLFVPTGRKTAPAAAGEELNLRLPMDLDNAIRAAAAVNDRTVQREILAALCAHFGLRLRKAKPKRVAA